MINAVHALMYVKDADAARRFFKETLGWPSVDAGEGWLIFALPPGEMGVHPAENGDENGSYELYLMCDDVAKTIGELERKGVEVVDPIADRGWGLVTSIRIPGGTKMGLYQPRHPTAHTKRR